MAGDPRNAKVEKPALAGALGPRRVQLARPTASTRLNRHPQRGPLAAWAATTGTDWPTYTRERPGMSAFALQDGVVYHTYSTCARGLDALWGMYQWLDRAPYERNETRSEGDPLNFFRRPACRRGRPREAPRKGAIPSQA
jgi:Bacterial protein of unknown function (DUF899)